MTTGISTPTPNILDINVGEHGFFCEANYKAASNDTDRDGIFVAGCAQGLRDITDTVAHALGAASRVQVFLAGMTREVCT